MFTRDYIMRQIHQLIQVLLQVLFRKQQEEPEQAQSILNEGLRTAFKMDLDGLCALNQTEVIALVSRSGAFHPALAVALADLLREAATFEAAERAYWLYQAAIDKNATLSLPAFEWCEDYRRAV